MTDDAGLKGAAQIAAEQVASTKNVRIRSTELRRAYDEMSKRSGEKTVYIAECEDALDGLRKALDTEKKWNATLEITARKDVEQARNEALEEAAQVAELYGLSLDGDDDDASYATTIIAGAVIAIRALKEGK